MSGEVRIGGRLAGYRIESLVGRGGMGVVYSAEQLRLGRRVALKVLAPELSADNTFRERFERESRLAALIDHPNIVPIYEAGEADGLLFIAMRWVEGRDLDAILKSEEPLSLDRTLPLLEQVAGALDAAHEHGLVHRDVKPANVLVAPGPRPGAPEHAYLTDFGIAKMAVGVTVTSTGMFLGTPDYASPEQFQGHELDGRADLYALGCLLYQCLTGSRPFERTQEIAVMYAHLHDPPPRVSETRSDVPPGLDDVVARAMAKRREDRYATCSEMVAAARSERDRWASPTIAAAAPVVAPTEVAALPPPVPPGPPPAEPPTPPKRPGQRRRKALWLGLAAAAVIGAAVAAVLVVTNRGDDEGGETTLAATTDAPVTEAPPATDTAPVETASATETVPVETEAETPTSTLAASELVWSRLAAETLAEGGGQEIARVAVTGNGLVVAAGSEGPARGHDVAFWTAAEDGGSPEKQVLAAPGDERAFGIAPTEDDGAIAVGYRQAEPPVGETGAAVWLRSGDAWVAAEEELGQPGYEKMNRVAGGPGGELVAVGTAGPGYSESGVPRPTDAAVWASEDGGATWTRADEAIFVDDGYQEMRGVAPFGDGFVAVGYDAKDAAVWRSDGGAWRRVGAREAFTVAGGRIELDMRDVTAWEGGLLAVGDVRRESGDRNGAAWLSADGETWTLVEAAAFGGRGDQQILGVVAGEAGIVAVGCTGCDTTGSRPAVWTSVDGEAWARARENQIVAADSPQQMNSVADTGDALVAGGWADAGDERDAAVWTASVG